MLDAAMPKWPAQPLLQLKRGVVLNPVTLVAPPGRTVALGRGRMCRWQEPAPLPCGTIDLPISGHCSLV